MAISEGSSPVWAPMDTAAAAMQRTGAVSQGPELPQGTSASCRQLDAAALIFPQGKIEPFLPLPLRVSISCFYFQWLGILGVDKGGLKRVSGVIYSSAFGPLCLFCCSFEIKEHSSRREGKKK